MRDDFQEDRRAFLCAVSAWLGTCGLGLVVLGVLGLLK